ncbi:hypothetical protein SI65_03763 [Aspergillus cristatus]|uniref:FAD-binding domain-containing protein n=1 Tax=Aspergillus cristatus TaxID=573508 RepID=A0A1E3BIC0_ASPCR|nr:hypothetical protein SI65_03763 [Aspergillus cristatus]
MAEHDYETTDVVICGCDPTGAMLSAYLGRLSVRHIVLEKEDGITTDPRGIALDEDGIRLLQGVGIYEHMYTDIGTCMQKFKFIGGTEKTLDTAPFLEMDYGTTQGGTDHSILRRNLGSTKLESNTTHPNHPSRLPTMGTRLHTPASLRPLLPSQLPLYLQPRPSCCMRSLAFRKTGYVVSSLLFGVMRMEMRWPGLRRSRRLFFRISRMLGVVMGYHRMFDSRKIASTSSAPDHSDSLQEAVMSGFVVESFSAVMPRMFFLHPSSPANNPLPPPSTPPKTNHQEVLLSWSRERKQLTRSLAATIANGNFVTERNPLKIFLRDWYLYILSFIPSCQRDLRLGQRKEGMIRYEYADGMPFVPGSGGGVCAPQVYVSAWERDAEVLFSDDILFAKGKKGLFQVLVYIRDPRELSSAREVVSDIEQTSNGELPANEATFIIETTAPTPVPETNDNMPPVCRLATAEEFAESPLCRGRPEPRYYNPYYLGEIVGGGSVRYVIVRPDRFVYASCDNKRDLEGVVVGLVGYLRGEQYSAV